MFVLTVIEYLLGLEVTHQFLHIIVGTLPCQELTRRDIEERHPTGTLSEMHGGKEIILLVVEHIILHGDTRGHQFGNTTLDEFLGEFRILQLVADGNTLTGSDQFRQISIEGMMGKPRHLVTPHPCPVITTSQGDT